MGSLAWFLFWQAKPYPLRTVQNLQAETLLAKDFILPHSAHRLSDHHLSKPKAEALEPPLVTLIYPNLMGGVPLSWHIIGWATVSGTRRRHCQAPTLKLSGMKLCIKVEQSFELLSQAAEAARCIVRRSRGWPSGGLDCSVAPADSWASL